MLCVCLSVSLLSCVLPFSLSCFVSGRVLPGTARAQSLRLQATLQVTCLASQRVREEQGGKQEGLRRGGQERQHRRNAEFPREPGEPQRERLRETHSKR